MARRSAGEIVEPFLLETLAHGQVAVPDPGGRIVHLSFRRFAGCPICNLHLRALVERHPEIEAAGVRTIALFHSSAEAMRPYQGDLPLPVAPDPEKRWYRAFGVESAPLAMLHPGTAFAAMRGLLTVKSHPMRGEGGHTGLPADFLVAPDGRLLAARYGTHPADAWPVDALLTQIRAVTT